MSDVVVGGLVGELDALVPLGAPFHLGEYSLSVNGSVPTIGDCGRATASLGLIGSRIKYWKGDLINLMEDVYGEAASQYLDKDFADEKELNECRFVAKNVTPEVRAQSPSFEHSKAIACLKTVKEQEKWIQRALDEGWIASKLNSEIATAKAGGQSKMRFLLIVDAGTEAKQVTLAKALEKDGFSVTLRTGVKREAKVKKVKAPKGAKPAAYKVKKGDKVLSLNAAGKSVTTRAGAVRPYYRKTAKRGK